MASIAAIALVLAACSGTEPTDTSGDPDPTATGDPDPSDDPSDTDARTGGSIVFEMEDMFVTDTLDPAKAISAFGLMMAGNVFEPLVTVDNDFNVLPLLAESWEPNDDLTVWTFTLRDGVEFHDGQQLTADDVVYSFKRQFDPELGAVFVVLVSGFLDADGVRAVDDRTIEFDLLAPNAFFPEILATTSFGILPDGTVDFDQPAGTGPFKVERWEEGEALEMVRNDRYWHEGLPYLDAIRVLRASESTTKIQSLIAGQTDLIDATDFNALPAIEGNPDLRKVVLPDAFHMSLTLDSTQEPFTDARVRQAFKMAIDRNRFVTEVMAGEGSPTADLAIPPSDPFFPSEIESWPYDPARATELLSEAGFPDGIDIEIYTTPSGAGRVDAAVVLAGMLEESGIRATVQNVPADRWFSEVYLIEPVHISFLLREHTAVISKLAYTSDATLAQSRFGNQEFDSAIDEALSAGDRSVSKEKFAEAYSIMNEVSGEVIPAFGNHVYVANSRVQGIELRYVQGGMVDFRQAYVDGSS